MQRPPASLEKPGDWARANQDWLIVYSRQWLCAPEQKWPPETSPILTQWVVRVKTRWKIRPASEFRESQRSRLLIRIRIPRPMILFRDFLQYRGNHRRVFVSVDHDDRALSPF